MSSRDQVVVLADWAARSFLRVEHNGRTRWCFLSDLAVTGMPDMVAQFVREATEDEQEVAELARKALRKGVLGEYQQIISTHDGLAQQRARIMDRFLSSKPLDVQRRELFERVLNRRVEDQATLLLGATWARFGMDALAQRVATGLKREHHAVLDDFLNVPTAAGVRQLLREMHASGELLPGEVHGGLKQQQRSDLMCWLPVSPEQTVLRQLLGALENLLLALVGRSECVDELGSKVPLMRGEAQCTCYPGGGARYVKHTDDARTRRRKLTCIYYAQDPRWVESHGGQLRLYPLNRPVKDVAPLYNRLVIFWSDSRVPHEVLPTHEPRYAVSVWYHDANSYNEPASRRPEARRAVGVEA